MSYRNGKAFLESKTNLIELYNEFGARVAVCPEWNGRVMTSTCDGIDGESFGLIRVNEIETTNFRSEFLAFGGEEQFSLSPASGRFAFMYSDEEWAKALPLFPPSEEETSMLPQGYREAAFEVDTAPFEPLLRMRRSLKMRNLAGTRFDLDLVRTVRLLAMDEIQNAFGGVVSVALDQGDVSFVAYETSSTAINRGSPLSRKNGLFSIRTRAMFNAGPHVVAFVPFRSDDASLGGELEFDYFGTSPHGVFRRLGSNVLLRADGRHRSAVSVPAIKAQPFFGAIDYRAGLLTIIRYNLPERPETYEYMSDFNLAKKSDPPARPYEGGILHAYNSGPDAALAREDSFSDPYFSFDVFTPVSELQKSESTSHRRVTLHVSADRTTLEFLVKTVFASDYDLVMTTMLS